MAFASYTDLEDCVSQNSDKENPKDYCTTVQAAVQGKEQNTGWLDVESWYNDRISETFISAPVKDSQGDLIETGTLAQIMRWLKDYGYYEWYHTGFPVGKMIGWCIKDGKAMIRVGWHDSKHSGMKIHDKIWDVAKRFGTRAFSSIHGLPELQRRIRSGGKSFNLIEELGVYGVGWVGSSPANPEARVTYLNELAKSETEDLNRTCDAINAALKKGDLNLSDETAQIEGLSQNDSKLANEIGAVGKMSWEECIAQAEQRGADDPEALCGWLRYHGPNAEKSASIDDALNDYVTIFGKRDAKFAVKAKEAMARCPRCKSFVERLVSEFGVDKSDAEILLQKRLDGLSAQITKTKEAQTTMSEEEEKAKRDAASADAAAKAKAAAGAGSSSARDYATEIDELRKSVATLTTQLADLVTQTQTVKAMLEKQASAQTAQSDTAKIAERVATIEKSLAAPASKSRGVEVIDEQLSKGSLSKDALDKVAKGETSLEEWRKQVGVKRLP